LHLNIQIGRGPGAAFSILPDILAKDKCSELGQNMRIFGV